MQKTRRTAEKKSRRRRYLVKVVSKFALQPVETEKFALQPVETAGKKFSKRFK